MKISVCVAATRPDTVGATARSIAAQTHGDWELIVIVQGGAASAVGIPQPVSCLRIPMNSNSSIG